MSNEMKVHLFKVVSFNGAPPLDTLLDIISNDPLDQRLRMVGHQEMRMEEALQPHTNGNRTPYWLLDFTKLRFEHGPGKASRIDAIEGFELDDNQGFGEETAALYDPQTHHLLIQYNHHGPRSGKIQEYFSTYSNDQNRIYELQIRLDETSEIRLAQKQIINKLQFKVAPSSISAAHRQGNISMARSIELSETLHGQTIEVTVSAGRGSLSMPKAQSMINALKRLVQTDALHNTNSVDTFKVSGKNNIDDATDTIDMLASKLEIVSAGLIMGTDLRYTQRSRWDALIRARNGWNQLI
jgi:hypothetical protein